MLKASPLGRRVSMDKQIYVVAYLFPETGRIHTTLVDSYESAYQFLRSNFAEHLDPDATTSTELLTELADFNVTIDTYFV